MARHGGFGVGGDADEGDVFAFERGQNGIDFVALAGIGNRQHRVAVHNHAQVAVRGFGGMDEKGGRAGGGEGGGDFVADVAGFADAGNDEAAGAVEHGIDGGGEIAVEAV